LERRSEHGRVLPSHPAWHCNSRGVSGRCCAWGNDDVAEGPDTDDPDVGDLATVAVVFHSLTVEIGDHELRWYFGPGLWTYRLPLDEIQSVATVQNQWWNGFGIRMAPGFTLYNVSGLDAVELRLKSGEVSRIGTDDPQGLAAALRLCRHN
jgi:hypothetical protein